MADQWHGTRYKVWPRVEEFVSSLPAHSLIADLGCGNGKLAAAFRDGGHCGLGCDFSRELVRIAAVQQGMEAQTADVMALPYRSAAFDAALSIAVLHHVSTRERRVRLIEETLRVLRPGGRALFYAWAAEQNDGRSGHEFPAADVFVPFHNRVAQPKAQRQGGGRAAGTTDGTTEAAPAAEAAAPAAAPPAAATIAESATERQPATRVAELEAMGGVYDGSKRAVVFQRYCHVYQQGELLELVSSVGGSRVLDEYYDTGNHCIVIQKVDG